MEYFFYICLFIFGILFGSFSSVIIYRFKTGEGGITNGRSHCPKCNHILNAIDLFPVFSWLFNKGKCRYCSEIISIIYPILELSMGALFAFIGFFLIDLNLIINGNFGEIFKLIFWLVVGFITVVYTFYDILFYEIHDKIMMSGIVVAIIGLVSNSFFYPVLNTIPVLNENYLIAGISSIIIIFPILAGLYIIMLKELEIKYDVLILIAIIGVIIGLKIFFNIENISDIPALSGLVGMMSIFVFFYLQIVLSGGKALGGGDLRIAIMIGLMLGISSIFPAMMLTYMVGSIIGIGILIKDKIKNKGAKLSTQVPFGPFLAIGFFLIIFYNTQIVNIISKYF